METNTLTLTAPEPVTAIAPSAAVGLVPVDAAKRTEVQARVADYVERLASLPAQSPEFGAQVDKLTSLGQREIREASGGSNRFLDKPIRQMDGSEGIGADLIKLRGIIDDLDPGRKGDLMKPRKLLGLIPFGSRLTAYFDSYQSAQSNISSILKSLASGKDELLMDNAAIDTERRNLWAAMGALEQMILMAQTLDERIEAKAADLDMTDPAKAKAIRETALFHIRQRHQDLLTQMAVTVQGYLALDLVKKNNVELVKGVDRASTTTVSALRTAVTVAQALTNQRLVLQQITALNSTTAGLIEGTSALMKSQSAAINEQAASSTIPIETLQRAFQNIYDTMDAIDSFKLKALDSMKTTIDALSVETEKARARAAKTHEGGQGSPDLLLIA